MRTRSTRARAIHLRPGDRVIVEVKHPLPQREMDAIKKAVQRWAGPDHPVIVTVMDILHIKKEE